MESGKKINWLSVFIRAIIVFIFALIIIWLVSKALNTGKKSKTFTDNINNMETVAIEYFKTVDLPLEKGKSMKITLGELIQKELIVSANSEEGKTCDTKKSYSEITREKSKYVVTTTLVCGKEKDTIKKDFSLKDCRNCNVSNQNNEQSNSDNSDNNNSNNSNNSSSTTAVTYYEYAKETTTYSKWMRGSKTGTNIENRYEYYGIDYATYYTVGAIKKGDKEVTYTLKLDKVPNSKYYFTTIEEVTNYLSKDSVLYQKRDGVSTSKGIKLESEITDIDKYALRENNFTYKLLPYYRKGSFYIDIKITLNEFSNVSEFYDSKLKDEFYLIPLKVKVKFASDEISDTKPEELYEAIPYYRYIITNRDVIWSTESYVEGYTKTGNTKVE